MIVLDVYLVLSLLFCSFLCTYLLHVWNKSHSFHQQHLPLRSKYTDWDTMKDYEDTIAFLGQWGRFQAIVFFLLCASIVPNGMMTFSSVFLADIPTHHCLIPDVNLTQEWLSAIIPKEVYIILNLWFITKYCTELITRDFWSYLSFQHVEI